jgi:LAO/AO transport system kinase
MGTPNSPNGSTFIGTKAAAADPDLLQRTVAGEFRAVARLITLVENDPAAAVAYLRELFPHTGRCFTIGVTGSPGAGKSTLVDALAGCFRSEGRKVGIIAVDPTSPFSGGAILGDRIRMQSRSIDFGTFIRSMATRGHLGGLARATADVLLVLDAAGFDIVIIETVGVGQDEVEIVRTAHATLVLLVPGMGDDIQAMKAGIMEIGDVFVINKADHAGVARIETELNALLAMSNRRDKWTPRVVRTVATEGRGVHECMQAIRAYREYLESSSYQAVRTLQIQRERLLELMRSRFMRELAGSPGFDAKLEDMARLVAERKLDPFSAVELLADRSPRTSASGKE